MCKEKKKRAENIQNLNCGIVRTLFQQSSLQITYEKNENYSGGEGREATCATSDARFHCHSNYEVAMWLCTCVLG